MFTSENDEEVGSVAPEITDPAEHMKKLPILRYAYRSPIDDPMDENYKFARRFEISCLNRESVRLFINQYFRPEMVRLSDEDLDTPETQARLEFYSHNGKFMTAITTKQQNLLKPKTLVSYMKKVVALHQKLLRDEVKEWKKEQRQKEKDET